MRELNKIIVHCADTRIDQNFSIHDVRRWHTDPKPNGRGWSDVGYHYYIRLNGEIEVGRSIEKQGAHCSGQNKDSIGICFEGGKESDGSKWSKPFDCQIESFKNLSNSLDLVVGDTLDICGHYEFSSKTCPNFNVKILF